MASNQPPNKRNRMNAWVPRKKKNPSGNSPSNEVDQPHVASHSQAQRSTIAADDIGRSTLNRNEHSTPHVDIAQALTDDGRSTSNYSEQPPVAHSGAHVDAAQPSTATSTTPSNAGQATLSRDEGTSAAQSGSNVNATPVAAQETIGSAGVTEGVTPAKKDKVGYKSYLGTGALIAGTVAELSDAVLPLKVAMNVLKVILENVSVS